MHLFKTLLFLLDLGKDYRVWCLERWRDGRMGCAGGSMNVMTRYDGGGILAVWLLFRFLETKEEDNEWYDVEMEDFEMAFLLVFDL